MNEQSLKQAVDFIGEHDDFLVVAHVNPDGDAVSSTLSIGWLLKTMGKKFTMANQDAIPEKLRELPLGDRILAYADSPGRTFGTVISVDCADYSRIGRIRDWFAPEAVLLNIDHHPTNDGFGRLNLLDSTAASTTQILFRLANAALDSKIGGPLADCLYTGLLTDTGGFRYSNTTPDVMKMASSLLDAGVKGHVLAEKYLERMTREHVRLLKRTLSTLSFSKDHRICWMIATEVDMRESGAAQEDLEGLVNYPKNIDGVEIGILFKEIGPNEIKVSLRSSGSADVSKVAQMLGGGGHVKAAGCTLNMNLADAQKTILRHVEQAVE